MVEKTMKGPGSFLAVQCDVSREEDVIRLFKVIKDELKGVDVCINNAGLNHPSSLLAGETDQWANMLNVNCDVEIDWSVKTLLCWWNAFIFYIITRRWDF